MQSMSTLFPSSELDRKLSEATSNEVGMIAGESWLSDCGDFQFALATGFLALSAHPEAQKSGRAMYAELAELYSGTFHHSTATAPAVGS